MDQKKIPVKNHTILFGSGLVVEPDQTKLGSTKPNKKTPPQTLQEIPEKLHKKLHKSSEKSLHPNQPENKFEIHHE